MHGRAAAKSAPKSVAASDEGTGPKGRTIESTLLFVRVLVAIAMFALAGALLLLTRELTRWRAQVPGVLAQSSDWQRQSSDWQRQASDWQRQVTDVQQQVEGLQPQIDSALQLGDRAIAETERVRREVFPVLREVKQVNGTVRAALPRIDAAIARVGGVEEQLPNILKTVQAAVDQVKRTNDAIPQILQEVRNTRTEAHQMLDQAQDVVKDTEAAGAEGAVKGFVTGVLKLPLAPVTGIRDRHREREAERDAKADGDPFHKDLDEADHALIRKATDQALAGTVGKAYVWQNPEAHHTGSVTAERAYDSDRGPCRDLEYDLTLENGKRKQTSLSICHNGKQWQVVDVP